MKEQYASIIEQLKWIPISYRHDGLQGIINELRLLFTGKSVRYKDKVKVIDNNCTKFFYINPMMAKRQTGNLNWKNLYR